MRCVISRLVNMIVGQMTALDLAYSSTLGVRPPEEGGLIPDSAGDIAFVFSA